MLVLVSQKLYGRLLYYWQGRGISLFSRSFYPAVEPLKPRGHITYTVGYFSGEKKSGGGRAKLKIHLLLVPISVTVTRVLTVSIHIKHRENLPSHIHVQKARKYTTRCYIFGKDTRFLSPPDHSTRLWGP